MRTPACFPRSMPAFFMRRGCPPTSVTRRNCRDWGLGNEALLVPPSEVLSPVSIPSPVLPSSPQPGGERRRMLQQQENFLLEPRPPAERVFRRLTNIYFVLNNLTRHLHFRIISGTAPANLPCDKAPRMRTFQTLASPGFSARVAGGLTPCV